MTRFDNFLTKVGFWNSSVSIVDKTGVLQFKTSRAIHIASNKLTRIYRASDLKTPWVQVRNMAGGNWIDRQYEIIQNDKIIAKIYIDTRMTPIGNEYMTIQDGNGQIIGNIIDNDRKLRGLSASVLGSFTIEDDKHRAVGTVEHKDHNATVKLTGSTAYVVNTLQKVDGVWEAVMVEVAILAALDALKSSGIYYST